MPTRASSPPTAPLFLAVLGALLLGSCRARPNEDAPPSPATPPYRSPSLAVAATPISDTADRTSNAMDTVTRIPAVVFRYRAAWDEIRDARGPADLPGLWALADSAGDSLMRSMERFAESTFQRAERLMVWHALVRTEFVSVVAEYDSFLTLARQRGTPSDTTFFAYLAAEDGGWKWKTRTTDFQACDELGSPHLLSALAGVERLRADSANPYRPRLPDLAGDLRRGLEYGLCACGTAPETRRDFESNLSATPIPPSLRPLLDSLREVLRAPRSQDRFACVPN